MQPALARGACAVRARATPSGTGYRTRAPAVGCHAPRVACGTLPRLQPGAVTHAAAPLRAAAARARWQPRPCGAPAAASAVVAAAAADTPSKSSAGPPALLGLVVFAVAALACAIVYNTVPGVNQALVDALAKSGFTAAFGLIFVSEIGDKTFFIAALLAMRRGRAVVMAGAVSALALMTGISVALGRLFTRLPDSFSSSLPLGEYCAAALLFFFGVKALKDALAMAPAAEGAGGEADEMEEAAALVSKADAEEAKGVFAGFIQTFSLIFVAEWGDRSMLATIALGAAQNPVGVFAGAVLGHALATLLAVIGGSLMSERISERTVGLTSGVLFLLFAAATVLGVF